MMGNELSCIRCSLLGLPGWPYADRDSKFHPLRKPKTQGNSVQKIVMVIKIERGREKESATGRRKGDPIDINVLKPNRIVEASDLQRESEGAPEKVKRKRLKHKSSGD